MKEPNNFTDIKNIDLTQFSKGIDLSHNNGILTQMTWNLIKGLGIEFLYHKLTEGEYFKDPACKTNVTTAKTNGLKTGYYHFVHTDTDFNAQIKNINDSLKLMPNSDLPFVLDFEVTKVSKDDNLTCLTSFINLFPGSLIYSTKSFLDSNLPDNHGLTQNLWLARYNFDYNSLVMPNGWNDFLVWQFTSQGKINGKCYDLDLMKK